MRKELLRISCSVFLLALLHAQTRPEFDVASIKPSKPADPGFLELMFGPGGSLNARNVSLKMLIAFAYGVDDFQIAGGPPWMESERYDVQAKVDSPVETEGRQRRIPIAAS